ncbi:hypothetical protein BTJ40_10865 [Microbulbifer sp. A4B17]|uniref:hypothetical protein n=1 Tax=Microbulbifer sp. A4B17 TaxID=359370 RepID=UPI000D52E2AA|nr:hypothetical protein [Microbulbifer sp. A4B17]AWF81279.1 hypothetical protein BTJ40_10865 [Microbulbifer sp. A4B17]
MSKLFSKKTLAVAFTVILASCGGGGGSSSDSDPAQSSGDSGGGQGSGDGSGNGSGDNGSGTLPDNEPGTVTVGDIETADLGFAQITSRDITLPNGQTNAREVHGLPHYIARTDSTQDDNLESVPMRSYTAACATDTDKPRMFVSKTLSEGSGEDEVTYGTVYELQYNPETSSFDQTGNTTILKQCYESHGIAASADCSRVAVLCNTEYQANERYDVQGDLVEQYGSDWMKMENNISAIDGRIERDIGLMISTNHSQYIGYFTDHPTLKFEDFLPGLKENFPETDFGDSPTFKTIKGNEMQEEMAYIVEQLSEDDYNAMVEYIRANGYKYNDQIWLMEWDNLALSEKPAAYVVNKMHGGGHAGAQELIYVENDSQGRTSYAFSVTARVFDSSYGGSHYSAGMTVIDRDNWSLNMSGSNNRGWYWLCGYGHVLNIRAFYNPGNEKYGAICTSDGGKYYQSRGLNTIAIKMEDISSYSSFEGYYNYLIPSDNAFFSNGGGHTVVPVDKDTNLSLIVSPKYIDDEEMNRFLQSEYGIDTTNEGPFDEQCSDNTNCFFSYMSNSDNPTIARQGLRSGDALESSSLTRIGIARVDGDGSIEGQGFKWLVEEPDCQISDPQLIDLRNGHYLFGYAQFQCISDNLSYNRSSAKNGAMRMLVPKAYYVMEIDADLNILQGPVKLTKFGWGGLDEPVFLGNGKVAWSYIKNPTIDNYGGGQQNVWQAMIYHSNSVN